MSADESLSDRSSNDKGPPFYNMGVTFAERPDKWGKISSSFERPKPAQSHTDWYQVTFPGDPSKSGPQYAKTVIDMLGDHLKPAKVQEIERGLSGYTKRTIFLDARGGRELQILHGRNPKPNVTASGYHAQPFCDLIRILEPNHVVTRMDSAIDFAVPGAWEKSLQLCQGVMQERNMDSGLMMLPDSAEKGATYYMGSRKSPVMARLYQKGYEQLKRFPECGADPDWVRLELQVRPQKSAKVDFASLDHRLAWGATKWSRSLIEAFSGWSPDGVRVAPRTETEFERTKRFLTGQYARHAFTGAQLMAANMVSADGVLPDWRIALRAYMLELENDFSTIIADRIKAGEWSYSATEFGQNEIILRSAQGGA